jgi:hypothetical protein
MWSGVLARSVPFEYQTCINVPSLYPQFTLHLQRVTYTKAYLTSRRYDSHILTAYIYGRNDVIFAQNRNRKWLLSAVRREFRELIF